MPRKIGFDGVQQTGTNDQAPDVRRRGTAHLVEGSR